MKKFLAFLASFTLIATSASSVIACGDTTEKTDKGNGHLSKTVKLEEKIRRQFALKLHDDLGIKEGDL
jgi:hypothetical protein